MSGASDPEPRFVGPSGARSTFDLITAKLGITRRALLVPKTRPKRREQLAGLLTIAPAFVLILALTLYPVAYSIWLSLLEKHSFFPPERFIGLEHFLYLWKDPEFWSSLWLGVVYSVWTIFLQVVLGVAGARVLNR